MKKTGRPSEYKQEINRELSDFFSRERFETIKVITTGKNEYYKEEEKRVAAALPTFERFAELKNISRDTLYEWESKHKEFSDTMAKCRQIQKDFLIQNGLAGLYQSNFAIFVAKNLTDMKDKTEVDNNVTLKSAVTKEEKDKSDGLINSYLNDNSRGSKLKG